MLVFQTVVSQTSYHGNQTVVQLSPTTQSTHDLYLSFDVGSLIGYADGQLPSETHAPSTRQGVTESADPHTSTICTRER